MRIAIIPARGGSKRIPRKNIKNFCGKPIIAYSIEVALDAGIFDRVIVSTDDMEIAEVSKKYGAEIPFIRSALLSDDYASTLDVISDTIQILRDKGQQIESVCCLYATAPFVRKQDLQMAYADLIDSDSEFVFTVTNYPFPIQRALWLSPGNIVNMFQPEHISTRSQDLVEAFHDAGQFYWGKADAFLEKNKIFGPQSKAFMLPRYRVQDIDTDADWTNAELIFKILQQENR